MVGYCTYCYKPLNTQRLGFEVFKTSIYKFKIESLVPQVSFHYVTMLCSVQCELISPNKLYSKVESVMNSLIQLDMGLTFRLTKICMTCTKPLPDFSPSLSTCMYVPMSPHNGRGYHI